MRGDATHSLEEARSKLKSMQGDVAKAQKVVIIGAGPVGLEYAGVRLHHLYTIHADGKRRSENCSPTRASPLSIPVHTRSTPPIPPKQPM
jgi:NADH dehydrogenase FAD-containing subunit